MVRVQSCVCFGSPRGAVPEHTHTHTRTEIQKQEQRKKKTRVLSHPKGQQAASSEVLVVRKT